MIDVCLLGTGGMMPLPNRYLTALLLRYHGAGILVDCGEATQIAMRRRGWSPKQIEMICFTHFHADHISGLPGMLLSMGNAERTEPLTMVGPKGLERVVGSLRVIAPELPFEIRFHELSTHTEVIPTDSALLPDFTVTAFKVHHNIPCFGYRFDLARGGRFDVDAAARQDIDRRYWNRLQKGETIVTDDGRTLTPDMVLGPARKGIKLVYTTDTRPVKAIEENARGSDLFICEGMYGEADKLEKARQNRHMTMYEAARIAAAADVKELWLTHYSPSLVNPGAFLPACRQIFPRTVASKDGRTVTLRFEDA